MADTAADWAEFFKWAGIPEVESQLYGEAFAQNRIRRSMLGALSKEYLQDMGIVAIGDVIAILQAATAVVSSTEEMVSIGVVSSIISFG